MSGDEDLVVQKMDETIDSLDKYEKDNGLPALKNPGGEEELDQYLTMDRTVVQALSLEECGDIAYRLKQYAFYVQRLHNKERCRLSWATTRLNRDVTAKLSSVDKYLKYPNKVALIAQNNSDINKVYNIFTHAKQHMQRLTYLSNAIKDMGDTLLAIQRIKLSMRREK